jgi:hypothetical protein
MKSRFHTILLHTATGLLIGSLTLASCNVTDLTPASSLTGNSFYKTAEDATAAVTSVYSGLTDFNNVLRIHYWGEARADQTSPAVAWGQDGEVQQAKRQNQNATLNLTNWAPMYQAIQRANDAIKGIGQMETDITFTEQRKKDLLGEAYTLRAWAYFTLVRTFGGVPLVTEPSDGIDRDYFLKQSTEAEVLDQIEKDLQYAITNMTRPQQSATQRRRASRGAAKALMVHVKAWRNEYKAAEDAATDLITNEGYTLEPTASYMSQWHNSTGTNEVIFALGFDLNKNNPLITKTNTNAGYGIIPAASWVQKYRARAEPVRGNTRTFLDLGGGNASGRILKYTGAPNPNVTAAGWDNAAWQIEPNVVARDLPMLRLADIYLLRAEARNRQNNSTGALADMNVIRQRANMPLFTATELNTLEKIEDAILDERDIELAFEGQRWYDLLRIARRNRPDVLINNATSILAGAERERAVQFLRDNKDRGGWLYPVNRAELLNNRNLVQQEAYR